MKINPRKVVMMAAIGVTAITVFTFIGGQLVMRLWNWLLPPLFGLPPVTFWQAVGLLALSRILFGGLGPGGRGRSRGNGFTPEEKARFRQRVRERFGVEPPAAPAPE